MFHTACGFSLKKEEESVDMNILSTAQNQDDQTLS